MTNVNWDLIDVGPREAKVDTGFAFGRYRTPVAEPHIASRWARFRIKEWCYQSISTPRFFVAFALAQLGYAAQLFAYVFDRETGRTQEGTRIAPLGLPLSFAPSSIRGTTRWHQRDMHVRTGFEKGIVTRLDLPLTEGRLRGSFRLFPEEALALVFPLSSSRAAYTHKAAGMRAEGELWFSQTPIDLSEAACALDWTRSYADRHTRWNWASFSGKDADGKRLGLNLSAHVYDVEGASMENALWVDGRVVTLRAVRFDVPSQTTAPWHIVSADASGEVDLTFTPRGERRSNLDLKLIRSVFTQPYGQVKGNVRGHCFDGFFGVVEDHDALW